MQNSQSDRAFRARLQKLLDARGDLFHHYSILIANPAVDLAGAMRDMATEHAKIEGDIAALFIEQGRPAEDEAEDAPATERVTTSMSTVVSKPISNRVAVTTYEKLPKADVEARVAGILDGAAHIVNGRGQVM
jgi:hypothetical protein